MKLRIGQPASAPQTHEPVGAFRQTKGPSFGKELNRALAPSATPALLGPSAPSLLTSSPGFEPLERSPEPPVFIERPNPRPSAPSEHRRRHTDQASPEATASQPLGLVERLRAPREATSLRRETGDDLFESIVPHSASGIDERSEPMSSAAKRGDRAQTFGAATAAAFEHGAVVPEAGLDSAPTKPAAPRAPDARQNEPTLGAVASPPQAAQKPTLHLATADSSALESHAAVAVSQHLETAQPASKSATAAVSQPRVVQATAQRADAGAQPHVVEHEFHVGVPHVLQAKHEFPGGSAQVLAQQPKLNLAPADVSLAPTAPKLELAPGISQPLAQQPKLNVATADLSQTSIAQQPELELATVDLSRDRAQPPEFVLTDAETQPALQFAGAGLSQSLTAQVSEPIAAPKPAPGLAVTHAVLMAPKPTLDVAHGSPPTLPRTAQGLHQLSTHPTRSPVPTPHAEGTAPRPSPQAMSEVPPHLKRSLAVPAQPRPAEGTPAQSPAAPQSKPSATPAVLHSQAIVIDRSQRSVAPQAAAPSPTSAGTAPVARHVVTMDLQPLNSPPLQTLTAPVARHFAATPHQPLNSPPLQTHAPVARHLVATAQQPLNSPPPQTLAAAAPVARNVVATALQPLNAPPLQTLAGTATRTEPAQAATTLRAPGARPRTQTHHAPVQPLEAPAQAVEPAKAPPTPITTVSASVDAPGRQRQGQLASEPVVRASTDERPSTPVARAEKAEPTSPAPNAPFVAPTFTPVIGTKAHDLKAPVTARPVEATTPAITEAPARKPVSILELAAQRTDRPQAKAAQPDSHERAEIKKDVELKRDDAPAAPMASPLVPQPKLEQPVKIEAPPPLAVAPALLEDPSLRVVLLPNVARLNVETQDAGSLSLQLKVHDGVTDVRAAGPAASLVEARQGELKVALAKEGLALGHFDLTQSDSGGRHHRFEGREDREPGPRRAVHRAASSPAVSRAEGRLSVKA